MTCREFRKQHGYTLKDFAIETGYSISAISKWEREQDTMPQDFVDKMFKKFNVVIERQHRSFVFNNDHTSAMSELLAEINDLQNTIKKLQFENSELKKKLKRIRNILQEQ